MAFIYDIEPNQPDSHQAVPHWFAAVIRLKYRNTFNMGVIGGSLASVKEGMSKRAADGVTVADFEHSKDFMGPPRASDSPVTKNTLSASLPDAAADPVAELDVVILDSAHIVNWTVNNGKGEHVKSLSMTLPNVSKDYAKDLAADDWILFWAFDNEADYNRVLTNVKQGKIANQFDDGLKFVGRLKAPKRIRTRNDGRFTVQYQVSAVSFGEMDSILYFNEILSSKYKNESLQWMIDLGGEYNNFITDANADGGIIAQTALPKLLNICLGVGPGAESKNVNDAVSASFASGSPEAITTQALVASPNVAYRIPKTVAKLLGIQMSDATKTVGLTYFDILQKYIGVQKYSAPTIHGNRAQKGDFRWQGLIPTKGQDLDGSFLPYSIDINQTTVWSLLKTYANEPINEMYTALKVTSDGSVMPTFVCRQIPFSSTLYANGAAKATQFTSLPRWKISESLVVSDHLGASDSNRINFVHVMGQDTTASSQFYNDILGYTRHAPIADQVSIMRCGLYPYEQKVSAIIIETRETNDSSPGRVWSLLLADIMMAGHLRWTGVINTKGIQEPISEGDNAEYDGAIYHIERIVHSGGINTQTGLKHFDTEIQVSHGVNSITETEPSGYNVYLTTEDYTGDAVQPVNPGLSVEV